MNRGLTLSPPEKNLALSEETGTEVFDVLLAEPYSIITGYFLDRGGSEIIPVDSESALYLNRIPVSEKSGNGRAALLMETGVLITSRGALLIGGKADPLLLLSIACFSLFVKFFHLILQRKRSGLITTGDFETLRRIQMYDFRFIPSCGIVSLPDGRELPEIIAAAGRSMVSEKLVDSVFGNLSALDGNRVIITETGSFLDRLEDRLTAVPLYGAAEGEETPSSEVEVHRSIYRNSEFRFIVHGHPLFTVILSLDEAGTGDEMRLPDGLIIPVLEVDDSPERTALCASVPRAIAESGSVVIRGHGMFAARSGGFAPAVQHMKDTENYCREAYFRRLR